MNHAAARTEQRPVTALPGVGAQLAERLALPLMVLAHGLCEFDLPQGVTISPFYDQSHLVRESIASVRDAILIGLILAARSAG